jgi:hypothetical protein
VPRFSLNGLQALCAAILDTILQPPIRPQLVQRICRKTPVGQALGHNVTYFAVQSGFNLTGYQFLLDKSKAIVYVLMGEHT